MLVMSCSCIIPKEMRCYTEQFLSMNMFAVASCGMVKAVRHLVWTSSCVDEYFTLPAVLTQFIIGWLFQSLVSGWRECIPFPPSQDPVCTLNTFTGFAVHPPPNLLRDNSSFSFAPSVTFL